MSELRRKPEIDFYKVLQVDTEAEPEVVEAAYRALSKKYHPDINPLPEAQARMSQINSAYEILGDTAKRRDYNLLRGGINHYIKPPATTSTANGSSAGPTYRAATNNSNANYSRPAAAANAATGNTGNTYKPGSPPNAANRPKPGPSNAANPGAARPASSQNASNRPRNPYQDAAPPPNSARAEAQSRAKGDSRAGHYIYDARKKLSPGRLIIIFCLAVVAIVVIVLVQENFLGNPFGTHFVTRSLSPATSATLVPIEQPAVAQLVTATPTAAPTPNSDTLTRENALAFLQTNNLFAGRVGQNDVTLNGDTLQLKLKLSDKGAGTNTDIAGQTVTPPNDPLAQLRNSETTAYAAIYPLFRQFTPQLKHIILGLTNANGDTLAYKADVTREAAYGFYPWQTVNSNMSASDLVKLATDDRLASHFGATQDDKLHTLLLTPDEATMNAEIASRGIEGTTVSVEPSGTVLVSYLLNHNAPETQFDFIKIIYALYTRFPNFDRLQLTTSVGGQPGGTTVWCNRELFINKGVATWMQKLYQNDVQELYSSLPKTEALLRQQTIINPPTPQAVNTTLRVRTWQVNVIKAEQINGVANYAPNGNNQLWAVTVEIRNGSSQQLYPMPDEIFSLSDSQHHLYQPDIAASVQYSLSNNSPLLAPLPAASGPIRLTLVFSVPRSTNNQKLSLQVRDSEVKAQVYLQ